MLNSSIAEAFEPEKITALIHLIKEDLGYDLHRAVQKVKCDLSVNTAASFRFWDGVIEIQANVERTGFEEWIAEELGQIENCIDSLISRAGGGYLDVDIVFRT